MLIKRPLGLATLILCLGHTAQARTEKKDTDKVIDIALGAAQTVRVPAVVERIIVGDPQVCDVVPLPPGQLLLIGKAAGETHITVWSRDGGATTYKVVASLPTGALQAALRDAFPEEEDIQVRASGGAVYMTGTVKDAATIEAANRLATSSFAGSGRKASEVINLLTTASPQQVQLHVRFVEITRTHLRNMGFNAWHTADKTAAGLLGPGDARHYSLTNDSSRFVGPANPLEINPGVNGPANPWLPMLAAPVSGSFALSFASTQFLPLTATLSLLETHGVAKTLSEPTLVTSSGKEGKILVGGEVPIPMPNALGQILIEFKSYGAQISFTPTVLTQDTVSLDLLAEVSDLDRTNGIPLAGTIVPALQARRSGTTIRLRDGQSFAVGGLLADKILNVNASVPLLGEIPVLGMLFRNTTASRVETELVVIASVHLVKPLDPGELPPLLRQDEFVDPSDVELFLMGTIDKTTDPASPPRTPTRPAPPRAEGQPASPGAAPVGAMGFSR